MPGTHLKGIADMRLAYEKPQNYMQHVQSGPQPHNSGMVTTTAIYEKRT